MLNVQEGMAERGRFELPIALRLCLISSQVHSTGLCHLSVDCAWPLRCEKLHQTEEASGDCSRSKTEAPDASVAAELATKHEDTAQWGGPSNADGTQASRPNQRNFPLPGTQDFELQARPELLQAAANPQVILLERFAVEGAVSRSGRTLLLLKKEATSE
jgi:hypothetical protein